MIVATSLYSISFSASTAAAPILRGKRPSSLVSWFDVQPLSTMQPRQNSAEAATRYPGRFISISPQAGLFQMLGLHFDLAQVAGAAGGDADWLALAGARGV